MAEEGPTKADIQSVFKKLRAVHANKLCFDCGARNPTWSSVTYGVFICIDCSATHRNLGVHITFVRSTQLDTNWTWLQLRAMQMGGNANATQFFKQHGSNVTDAQQKYKSRAAGLYRDKLHHLAVQAIRLHGTTIHLDDSQLSPVATEQSVDFFDEHVSSQSNTPNMPYNLSEASVGEDAYIGPQRDEDDVKGPRVEHSLTEESKPHDPKKSTLLAKKSAAKKAMFGGKKGAFRAQRVTANFEELEQKAADFDQKREASATAEFVIDPEPDSGKDQVEKLSARLMMQDISDQKRKQQEQKLKDPKNAQVVDRLGMAGIGQGGAVSHSVATGIKSIRQEGVRQKNNVNTKRDIDYTNRDDDNSWEILGKEPFGSKQSDDDDSFLQKSSNEEFFDAWDAPPIEEKRPPPRMTKPSKYESNTAKTASDEASKKFGNAKSISSDQYFGGGAIDYETRSNLSKFEGSTGIGSADLFGNGSTNTDTAYYGTQFPEMAEIKDSVRQGVTKVAGKLSNLGSSVTSYLSDRY